MLHFASKKDDGMTQNMSDITSDFACLKVSALGKALRISREIDRITIGPDSVPHQQNTEKFENIENEKNSCNVKPSQNTASPQNNKTLPQNDITFTADKIKSEQNLQRREEVQKNVDRRVRNMKKNAAVSQERARLSQLNMARERERKNEEDIATMLANEEKIAEEEKLRRKHEHQLHSQHAQVEKARLENEIELIRNITALSDEVTIKYGELMSFDKVSFLTTTLSSHLRRLEDLFHQKQIIDHKIKNGEGVLADLATINTILRQIEEVLCLAQTEKERLEALEDSNTSNVQEIEKHETQEVVSPISKEDDTNNQTVCQFMSSTQNERAEENIVEEIKNQSSDIGNEEVNAVLCAPGTEIIPVPSVEPTELEPITEQSEKSFSELVDDPCLQLYTNTQQFLENHTRSYNEFTQSSATKKFRFECQKAINVPVNAISAISEQHLRDKFERLHNLLIGRSSPNVSQYSHGIAFCNDMLAKKIVNQGETLVSSKPKMAFAIAAIAVALWNEHPDLGQLLLAHFHKTCPFTVPIFMRRREGQTNEEYYRSLGYKYAEDGAVEKQDKYLKRMSGVMRLYTSISVTSQRRGVRKGHPHGLQNIWRWLAAILNSEPRPELSDLYATFIFDVLEVAGSALWNAYPKQFRKLLMSLASQYYPHMQNSAGIGGGPLTRLEEFLKNALASGSISPPDGILPRNFW